MERVCVNNILYYNIIYTLRYKLLSLINYLFRSPFIYITRSFRLFTNTLNIQKTRTKITLN